MYYSHSRVPLQLYRPDYLDSADKTAELYLNGSQPIGFVFDGVAARFANYTDMLKIAGFEA